MKVSKPRSAVVNFLLLIGKPTNAQFDLPKYSLPKSPPMNVIQHHVLHDLRFIFR